MWWTSLLLKTSLRRLTVLGAWAGKGWCLEALVQPRCLWKMMLQHRRALDNITAHHNTLQIFPPTKKPPCLSEIGDLLGNYVFPCLVFSKSQVQSPWKSFSWLQWSMGPAYSVFYMAFTKNFLMMLWHLIVSLWGWTSQGKCSPSSLVLATSSHDFSCWKGRKPSANPGSVGFI